MPHTVTIVGGIPYQSTPGHHNQPVGIDGLRKGNETRLSAASAVHGIGAAQYELGAHNLMRVFKRLTGQTPSEYRTAAAEQSIQ